MRMIYRFSCLLLCLLQGSCTSSTHTATQIIAPNPTTLPPTQTIIPTSIPKPTQTITTTPMGEAKVILPVLAGTQVPWPDVAITSENGVQITELAHWGRGMITAVVWAPDGNSFAVAMPSGIYIYDNATFQELDILYNDSLVNSIAYSPDGTKLALSLNGTEVKIWDVASGSTLQTLEWHGDYITGLAFSPEGVILGSYYNNEEPLIWDSGELVSGDPYAIQGPITLWDAASGQELRTLCGSAGFFTFSPDWSKLATVSGFQAIKLWDTTNGEELRTLAGNNKPDILGITFSSDGRWLASWSGNNTIKVWDVATGNEQITLSVGNYLSNVTFLQDGKTLAYIADSGLITVLDIASGQVVRTLGNAALDGNILLSPDGKMLLYYEDYGDEIKLFDIASGKELHKLNWPTYIASSLAVSPDGRMVALGLRFGNIKLLDAANGQELRTLAAEGSSLAFSPDGALLASGSSDQTTRLWDVSSGEELYSMEGAGWGWFGEAPSVDFSPDGKLLAFAGQKGQVKVWDVTNHVELLILGGQVNGTVDDLAMAVEFSPDGKILASGYASGTITLWDTISGQELRTLIRQGDSPPMGGRDVSLIEFSPDGKMLVSRYWDNKIFLWDVESGSELYTISPSSDPGISDPVLSPGGDVLAVGIGYKSITLLDTTLGKELVSLASNVDLLAFSPDGKVLISSAHGVIRLWGIAP